ncbi:hypothetical protein GQR36_15195 [Enterococcus termitis]
MNTIVLPIQNIVLADEFSTAEEVVTEETKINEFATVETKKLIQRIWRVKLH